MALSWSGTGSIFVRLGKLGGILNAVNAANGSSLGAQVAAIPAQYASAQQGLPDAVNLFAALDSQRSSASILPQRVADLARRTLIEQVHADTPLQPKTLYEALAELIKQMKAGSQSVELNTVGSSVTAAGGNTGSAKFVVGLLDNDGLPLRSSFAETIRATCTTDRQSGAASKSEQITLVGASPASGPLAWDWPLGSGLGARLTLVDAARDGQGGQGNRLTNGDFEDWTVLNVPDRWSIDDGTPSGSVFKSTSPVFGDGGTACLRILGDGTETTTLSQEFGSPTGTSATLAPLTTYAYGFWARTSGAPAAGALRIALVDGSGTVVDDEAGNDNATTSTLTTLGTSWTFYSGTFRTPRVMPSVVKLQLKLTTALTATYSLYIDRLAFCGTLRPYAGGPFLAGFSEATDPIRGDGWSIAVTNDRNATSVGAWNTLFERFFGMAALGLKLPDSGSPTISDSLIA